MEPIKLVELNSNDTAPYYDFLTDNLQDKAIELIQAIPNSTIRQDIKLGYSLSYCQGDGVSMKGGSVVLASPGVQITNKNVLALIEVIKTSTKSDTVSDLSVLVEFYDNNSRYNHENSFGIIVYFDCLIKNEDGKYERISETSYDIYAPKFFIKSFVGICKELEKYGYDLIEEEDRQEMCREALIRFCNVNNFEDEEYIEEYEYTTDEKQITDDMIQVSTKGNTSFDGLWVALPSFEERTRDEHYRAFID